jgi:hypothetical protein
MELSIAAIGFIGSNAGGCIIGIIGMPGIIPIIPIIGFCWGIWKACWGSGPPISFSPIA